MNKKINENINKPLKVRSEKIQEIVDEIMSNGVTKSPFDYLFRSNVTKYPQTNHELLELPGKFKNIERTSAFIEGKGDLEMDFTESVMPDKKMIMGEASIDLEQETGRITGNKIETIFNYVLSTIIALKKPCYPFVATNHEYDANYLVQEIEGILLKIYLIIFDEKKIYEILNTLKSKDYSIEEFSESDYLLFIYLLVFAKKPFVYDIINELVKLFLIIENMLQEYQIDLYLTLCMMIKYHFKGNDMKIRELITMITQVMQDGVLEDLPTKERDKIMLAELTEKFERSEKQRITMEKEYSEKFSEKFSKKLSEELSKKDKEYSEKLSEKLSEELSKKDKEYSEKLSEELSKKDKEFLDELSEKNRLIEKLQKKLEELEKK